MDGRMHRKTAAWACRHAVSDVWMKYIDEISEAGTYPDTYVFGEDAPDKTGWDRYWRALVQIPHNGRRTPMHRVFDTLNIHGTYPEVIRYLVNLSLDAFRAGDEELAVKAGGVLTHLTGDTIQPAHTTDNRLVTMMWPQDRYNMRYMTHSFMELVLCDLDDCAPYTPRLLAEDAKDFVWRLTEEMEIGRRKSMGEIPILMDSNLRGDIAAARESAGRTAYACAQLDADIFYTLSAIAGGIARREAVLDMTRLVPVAVGVDNMFNYDPMINYIPGGKPDAPTRIDIGDGPVNGVALLPMLAQSYLGLRDSFATYSVDRCGYSVFTCKVGIQRFRTPEQVPHHSRSNETACIFEIRLDGRTVYRSQPLTDADPSESVWIELDGAKELTLYVRDERDPNPLTRFVFPVFAEPKLED